MPTMAALMTGAELACTRAFLGFSQAQLADFLKLGEHGLRRLQRMEKGEAAIPSGIVDEIDEMYEMTNNLVANMVVQYRQKTKKAETAGEDVVLITQRDGEITDCGRCGHADELHSTEGGCSWISDDGPCECTSKRHYPACWHRAVCARVAAQVPGIIIDYAD